MTSDLCHVIVARTLTIDVLRRANVAIDHVTATLAKGKRFADFIRLHFCLVNLKVLIVAVLFAGLENMTETRDPITTLAMKGSVRSDFFLKVLMLILFRYFLDV